MTDATQPDAEGGEGDTGTDDDFVEFHRHRTWVDRVVGSGGFREQALRATGFSVAVFGLGFLVALPGGAGVAYLETPSAYPVVVGTFLASLSYAWGTRKFLAVWDEISGAFAVSDETYDEIVHEGLAVIYNDRAIAAEFVAVAAAVFFLQLVVPVPPAIEVGFVPFAEIAGVTVLYSDLINNTVGVVVLLYVVTGIHMSVNALRLLYRVTHLPLELPRTAAGELQAFADFSTIAATLWFLVLLLVLFVYRPWLDYVLGLGDAFGIGFWVTGLATILVLVGVAIFLVPQVAIHAALVDRKQDRLRELDAELESLTDSLREGDRSPDEVSMALELHDRRRERVKQTRTWIYDMRRLLQLAASGVAASVSLLGEVLALPWFAT